MDFFLSWLFKLHEVPAPENTCQVHILQVVFKMDLLDKYLRPESAIDMPGPSTGRQTPNTRLLSASVQPLSSPSMFCHGLDKKSKILTCFDRYFFDVRQRLVFKVRPNSKNCFTIGQKSSYQTDNFSRRMVKTAIGSGF